MIYHIRGEHANHYATTVMYNEGDALILYKWMQSEL